MVPVQFPAGYSVLQKQSVVSTNDEMQSLAETGAVDGTIVIAETQSAGRGRVGRKWVSDIGNLYFSLLVKPQKPISAVPQLSFVTALAVADSVSEYLSNVTEIKCKWPNDVIVDGRKIAGILLESAPTYDQRIDWLVIGVGINIASHPCDVLFPATSMQDRGAGEVSPLQLLSSFCRNFSHWRDIWEESGFIHIRKNWLERAAGLGEYVQFNLQNRVISGLFDGLNNDGTLSLLQENGQTKTVSCGDLFFCND